MGLSTRLLAKSFSWAHVTVAYSLSVYLLLSNRRLDQSTVTQDRHLPLPPHPASPPIASPTDSDTYKCLHSYTEHTISTAHPTYIVSSQANILPQIYTTIRYIQPSDRFISSIYLHLLYNSFLNTSLRYIFQYVYIHLLYIRRRHKAAGWRHYTP